MLFLPFAPVFYVKYFPEDNFPNGIFPSQSLPQRSAPLAHPSQSVGPNCSLRRLRCPNLTCGKLLLMILSLGKLPLRKYLTSF